MPHYEYNNQDITIDILMKVEQVVRIISEQQKIDFDTCLAEFYKSKTFKSLNNPLTCMWAESSEFIAQEFLSE